MIVTLQNLRKLKCPFASLETNGTWKARSLTHGRIVFMESESQIVLECKEIDLVEYAKTVTPNRRSRKQKPVSNMPPIATETASVRKIKQATKCAGVQHDHAGCGLSRSLRIQKAIDQPSDCGLGVQEKILPQEFQDALTAAMLDADVDSRIRVSFSTQKGKVKAVKKFAKKPSKK